MFIGTPADTEVFRGASAESIHFLTSEPQMEAKCGEFVHLTTVEGRLIAIRCSEIEAVVERDNGFTGIFMRGGIDSRCWRVRETPAEIAAKWPKPE